MKRNSYAIPRTLVEKFGLGQANKIMIDMINPTENILEIGRA